MTDGFVPWWEWREGKRPPGWTEADERKWRGDGRVRGSDFNTMAAPAGPVEDRVSARVDVRFDEHGEVVEYKLAPSDEEVCRGWRAMMLARDLETCRALLRGQSVPLERLDPEWVERFGRRR